MRTQVLCATLLLAPLAATDSLAQASDSLSFQGRLTDDSGVPVTDPSVEMTFKLYKHGMAVWTETHPSVVVDNGVFDVILGGTTPLDTVRFNVPMEIGVKVEGDPEISPRTPLTASAFAKALPGFYTFQSSSDPNETFNIIGGAPINYVGANVHGATIAGGGGYDFGIPEPNVVDATFATVGGGAGNSATGTNSTVSGGVVNEATGESSTIGGGVGNTAGSYGTIAGGGEQPRHLELRRDRGR